MNNNVSKKENLEIEYLVLKNFIMVLKENHMYPMFRCIVGSNTRNVISTLYNKLPSFYPIIRNQSKDNVFRDAPDIQSCVNMMRTSFEGGVSNNEKDPAKIQHHIANCVNMLLHIFIERNVRDFQKLEKMGGTIFEMTCREIFGGEFEDVLPPPPGDVEKMRQINEMIINSGQRPTREMLDQIRQILEEQRNNQNLEMPEGFQPMVNEEDWDFLDDFLDEQEEEIEDDDWEEEDEPNNGWI